MSFNNRWMIRGILTNRTNMHIGVGDVVTRPALLGDEQKPVLIQAVATDVSGRAYIPGSAIKGNLRSWLERNAIPSDIMEKLFGSRDQKKDDAQGGAVEFWDARAVKFDDIALLPPHWDAERLTGVVASVAINRQTGAAADNKLFHQEYVPPGIGFETTITGQNLEDGDIGLLLHALEKGSVGDEPILLGSASANCWGSYSWQLSEIRFIDKKGVERWLNSGTGTTGYNALEALPKERLDELAGLARGYATTVAGKCRLVLGVTLYFESLFLVNDRLRVVNNETADHIPRRNEQNRLILPATAFRGALRSQAERIIRTSGGKACGPEKPCDPITDRDQIKKRCPVCRVFGCGGWRSLLGINDFVATTEPEPIKQEFVAIDRFTGGAADKKKFNALAVPNPVMEGTITLDLAKCAPADLGLLVLLLRDLIEGDITFGFGSAKGYGACRARISACIPDVSLNTLEKSDLLAIIKDAGYELSEASEWQPEPIENERTRNLLTALVEAFNDSLTGEVTNA